MYPLLFKGGFSVGANDNPVANSHSCPQPKALSVVCFRRYPYRFRKHHYISPVDNILCRVTAYRFQIAYTSRTNGNAMAIVP